MREFHLPQREIEARVVLHQGHELAGTLFVSESAPGGGPGRLIDRLNEPGGDFLPFRGPQGRRELLHRRFVAWIETRDEEAGDPAEGGLCRPVEIELASGAMLQGSVSYAMRPQRERVLDFLNAAPLFFAVSGVAGRARLIHRRFVVRVRDLSASTET